MNINAFFIRQSSLTAGSCEVTTLGYRPPARLEHDPLCFSKYTSCGVLKSPGNGSEITGRRRNKKTLQAPKKGLQRCFLASQKRFELPTPRLGDGPKRHKHYQASIKKPREIKAFLQVRCKSGTSKIKPK